jgi:hypothetical protein
MGIQLQGPIKESKIWEIRGRKFGNCGASSSGGVTPREPLILDPVFFVETACGAAVRKKRGSEFATDGDGVIA